MPPNYSVLGYHKSCWWISQTLFSLFQVLHPPPYSLFQVTSLTLRVTCTMGKSCLWVPLAPVALLCSFSLAFAYVSPQLNHEGINGNYAEQLWLSCSFGRDTGWASPGAGSVLELGAKNQALRSDGPVRDIWAAPGPHPRAALSPQHCPAVSSASEHPGPFAPKATSAGSAHTFSNLKPESYHPDWNTQPLKTSFHFHFSCDYLNHKIYIFLWFKNCTGILEEGSKLPSTFSSSLWPDPGDNHCGLCKNLSFTSFLHISNSNTAPKCISKYAVMFICALILIQTIQY